MRRVVARWKERGAKSHVSIVGHTDAAGDSKKNFTLSQKRAERVAKILAGYGLDPQYMILQAYGEKRPFVPSGRNTLRSQNRRVEISFSKRAVDAVREDVYTVRPSVSPKGDFGSEFWRNQGGRLSFHHRGYVVSEGLNRFKGPSCVRHA